MTISTASGELFAHGAGNLPISVASGEPVLSVAGLTSNLYSILQATRDGRIAVLTHGKFRLFESDHAHFKFRRNESVNVKHITLI